MLSSIIKELPKIRGNYILNFPLKKKTWFQTGGTTDVFLKPYDLSDLKYFMECVGNEVPLFTIGSGSNLLIRDGGIRGVTIKLTGSAFSHFDIKFPFIEIGSASLLKTVALKCQEAGLSGLEFFIGIPGTIGGAIRMNAGCYGKEMSDVLHCVEAVDPFGNIHKIDAKKDVQFSYRYCSIPNNWIFTKVTLKVSGQEDPIILKFRLAEILKKRELSQPIRVQTGGSTFCNPIEHNKKAWELIDDAGCRGLKLGRAQVSEKHCNFLINLGGASSKDIEDLGEIVRSKVLFKTNIKLKWEIIRIGEK